jgi:hypothetical protein
MRPSVTSCVAAAAGIICLAGCAAVPRQPSENQEPSARYENPPGSPKRTHIITRLPALVGRFIKHAFAPETLDRGHVLDHDTVLASFEAAGARNAVTWIGHMTALLRIDGVTILTDPWWGNYALCAARARAR